MEITRTEERARIREEKGREAIELALKGLWEEAVQVNRRILELYPADVEALNRLGKALLETGRYAEAREAFQETLRLSPHNAIARKNLERLARFEERDSQPEPRSKVAPNRFIQESGRSGVTLLTHVASREVLAGVAPGDSVGLQPEEHALTVRTLKGEYLGRVEPRLARRLVRLMKGGNRYEGAIVSVGPEQVVALLVEVFRHPDQAGITSFPSQDSGDYRTYFQDTALQYNLDDDEGDRDEVDMAADWNYEGVDSLESLNDAQELEVI